MDVLKKLQLNAASLMLDQADLKRPDGSIRVVVIEKAIPGRTKRWISPQIEISFAIGPRERKELENALNLVLETPEKVGALIELLEREPQMAADWHKSAEIQGPREVETTALVGEDLRSTLLVTTKD